MSKQDAAKIAALVRKNSAKQAPKPKDPSQFDDTLRLRPPEQDRETQRMFKDMKKREF